MGALLEVLEPFIAGIRHTVPFAVVFLPQRIPHLLDLIQHHIPLKFRLVQCADLEFLFCYPSPISPVRIFTFHRRYSLQS
ncbi:hypothetical protein D3C81_1679050 [compost metagenome]